MRALFLTVFIGITSSPVFASWEILVDAGKHKVWRNKSFSKVYIASSGKFLRRDASKKKLLKLFHLTEWQVLKETEDFLYGSYLDTSAKLNYFLETKQGETYLVSTTNRESFSRLQEIYLNFRGERGH